MIVTRGFTSNTVIVRGYATTAERIVAFAEGVLRRYRMGGSSSGKKKQIHDVVREIAVFARLILVKEQDSDNITLIKEIFGTKTRVFNDSKYVRVDMEKTGDVKSKRNDISIDAKRINE